MDRRTVSFVEEVKGESENPVSDTDAKEEKHRKPVKKKGDVHKKPPKGRKKSKFVDDHLSRKIKLLQDILYELPELETNLVNSIYGAKPKQKKSISAKIIRFLFALIFVVLMYSSIFVLGLTVASYLMSPIPLTGTLMTNYADENVEDNLQKIVIVPPGQYSEKVKIRGSFKVAYNVFNNTPFSGALSVYMDAAYLPQSGSKTTIESCFGSTAYKHVYKYTYRNVKKGVIDFFTRTEFVHKNASKKDEDVLQKKRSGSLITLEKVINQKDMPEKALRVLEATAYNTFTSYRLVGNKVEIIPKIARGFNKVVVLVTLEADLNTKEEKDDEAFMAKRMLYECKNNGFLTLKFDSSLQKFDTMLFGGNMLPTSFMPVAVPCSVSEDKEVLDRISDSARDQRLLYNRQQYILKKLNTSLNM